MIVDDASSERICRRSFDLLLVSVEDEPRRSIVLVNIV